MNNILTSKEPGIMNKHTRDIFIFILGVSVCMCVSVRVSVQYENTGRIIKMCASNVIIDSC